VKRTPLKRKTPLARGGRVNPVSAKRREENAERRKVVERMVQQRGPICQAQVPDICFNLAVDAHEVLPRGRGGSITDPKNILLVCRRCHEWIGANPREATERGLLRSAYDGRDV